MRFSTHREDDEPFVEHARHKVEGSLILGGAMFGELFSRTNLPWKKEWEDTL